MNNKENERKTIVFLISNLKRTGPVNILFDIVKYLNSNIYKPYIITFKGETHDSRIEDFKNLGAEIIQIDFGSLFSFGETKNKLNKKLAEIAPIAVHSFGFKADIITAFVSRKYNTVTSQLNYIFDDYVMTYGRIKGNTMALFTLLSLRKFNSVISCSKDVQHKLLKKGIKSFIVNNSIDQELFYPITEVEKKNLRSQMNLPIDVDIFIFVGVLTDRKQPLIAIEGFLKYIEQRPNSILLMLGDGDQFKECQELTKNKKDNFVFKGKVASTKEYLGVSDFYIATSKAEGMPVSVLEALALGLPVILSDINPHREILEYEPEAGVLIKTGSILSTFEGYRQIAAHTDNNMKAAAQKIIDLHLNAKLMSEKYQYFYNLENEQ